MPRQLNEIIASIASFPFKGRVRVGMGLAFSSLFVMAYHNSW
jgi:hypothetical protein